MSNILKTLPNSVKSLVPEIQLTKNLSNHCTFLSKFKNSDFFSLTVIVTNLWYSDFALSATVGSMALQLTNLERNFSKAVSEVSGHSAIDTGDRHLGHQTKQDENKFFQSTEYTFSPLQPLF